MVSSTKDKFIGLLDYLKEKVETNTDKRKEYFVSNGNDNGLENLVKDLLTNEKNLAEIRDKFDATITLEFGHHFPDITVLIEDTTYGIELKSRNNGSWATNGGSTMESITSDYKEIYTFFGTYTKKEMKYKVRYKPYWQTIDSIKVTHSPRFGLNMDAKDRLFKSEEEYDNFRNALGEEKIKFIQTALKKSVGQAAWYIPTEVEVKVEKFKTLSGDEQKKLKNELMILFPWDLLKSCIKDGKECSNANYDNIINYCLANYYVLVTRDLFSAGGQGQYQNFAIPKIMAHYRDMCHEIIQRLNTADPDFRSLVEDIWFSKDTPKFIRTAIQECREDSLEKTFRNIINAIGEEYWKQTLSQIGVDNLSTLLLD